MKAYLFPGQGAQFSGMGFDLYKHSPKAKAMFEHADDLLGFGLSELMFEGTAEALKQTKVTQPAIFLHSTVLSHILGADFKPDMVAGHSLGEFSALVASGALKFEDGLRLVFKRAEAMQRACELEPSTMAAVLGMEDERVEQICQEIRQEDSVTVVPANYNCPGQLVISGSISGVEKACVALKEQGARRALILSVGGAFHSPLMAPAQEELAKAISETVFQTPSCPIYQNVTAKSVRDAGQIQENLIQQLTAPVRWTQTIKQMLADGANQFIEVGPGKVLQGLVRKLNHEADVSSALLPGTPAV